VIKPTLQIPIQPKGFTLIELMVTITIAGIMLGIAVPNFQTFMQNGRQNATASEFQKTLQMARDEAVARNTNMVLCATANNTTCSNTNTWENGYLIAATATPTTAFTVISVHDALDDGQTLRAVNGSNTLTFTPNGLLRNTDSFRICDARGTSSQKGFVIAMGGIRSSVAADNIGNCP
jgi:type IV fimbrial biogenesis protein FimT